MDNHKKLGAVLVTGASTGIGRATALHLARLGFTVFATVRRERDAQALCADAPEGLVPVLMDVTDPTSIARAKAQVSQAVGEAGLAGLVNNAGVAFCAPLEYVPLEEVRGLFEVNVFGLLAVTQAFLPLLRQGKGRVLNVSSIASLFVVPFHGVYAASKKALNGLSDALRLELKPHGVQVSVLVCGSIQTPIWEKATDTTNRITTGLPSQAMELYGGPLQTVANYFNKMGKAGVPVDAVSREVVHALTARRAKNSYYIGPDAQLYKIIDKLVHGRLRDWLVMSDIK